MATGLSTRTNSPEHSEADSLSAGWAIGVVGGRSGNSYALEPSVLCKTGTPCRTRHGTEHSAVWRKPPMRQARHQRGSRNHWWED